MCADLIVNIASLAAIAGPSGKTFIVLGYIASFSNSISF
jgi:hypothetical protein